MTKKKSKLKKAYDTFVEITIGIMVGAVIASAIMSFSYYRQKMANDNVRLIMEQSIFCSKYDCEGKNND